MSVKRGARVGVYLFLKNAVLEVRVRLGLFRVSVNPNPKRARVKIKIDPDRGPDSAVY